MGRKKSEPASSNQAAEVVAAPPKLPQADDNGWLAGSKPTAPFEPINSSTPYDPTTPRFLKVFVDPKGKLKFDYHVTALRPVAKVGDPGTLPGTKILAILDLTELPLE